MAKAKRNYRKKTSRKTKRGSRRGFKSMVKSAQLFVLPPRVKTKMSVSLTGTQAAGFMLGAGNYFVTYANTIYQPFNTASATFIGTWTATQGTNISNNPVGYTIMSAQYGRYKITNVRYEISAVVGSNQDTMAMYIYPFVWATGTAGLNPFNAQSQPGCKYKVCNQSGASSSDNKIVATYNIRKYLGMTKSQYDAQMDTLNNTTPVQLLGVNFGFEPLNATANVQPVSVDIKAIYTVEWSQPIVLIN